MLQSAFFVRETVAMKSETPTCFIVDDDQAICHSISQLLQTVDISHQSFPSAEDFQANYNNQIGCLVLDIRLHGMSGLMLQKKLIQEKSKLPVIFLTGHGNINMAVKAMKEGAFDFITKPFHNQELLDKIHLAMNQHRTLNNKTHEREKLQKKINSLTPREKQLLDAICEGKQTKQIADQMNISINTAQIHRANLMKKMDAKNLGTLINMVLKLKNYYN